MKKQEIEKVLKNIYLDVMREQLDNVNPFYASIKKGNDKVQGKDIIHYVNVGEVKTPLQNLYCTIEIPEKTIDNCFNTGSIVDIINSELIMCINTYKDLMQKSLWFGNGKKDICSMPNLLNDAIVINGESQISDTLIHQMLDRIEETRGEQPNIILASYEQRRAFLSYLYDNRKNVDYITLDGNYKSLSCNGIPLIADKYLIGNKVYFINTKDFELQQLCDWMWLEDDSGNILRKSPNEKCYTATLVKYANLICTNPQNQLILEVRKEEL